MDVVAVTGHEHVRLPGLQVLPPEEIDRIRYQRLLGARGALTALSPDRVRTPGLEQAAATHFLYHMRKLEHGAVDENDRIHEREVQYAAGCLYAIKDLQFQSPTLQMLIVQRLADALHDPSILAKMYQPGREFSTDEGTKMERTPYDMGYYLTGKYVPKFEVSNPQDTNAAAESLPHYFMSENIPNVYHTHIAEAEIKEPPPPKSMQGNSPFDQALIDLSVMTLPVFDRFIKQVENQGHVVQQYAKLKSLSMYLPRESEINWIIAFTQLKDCAVELRAKGRHDLYIDMLTNLCNVIPASGTKGIHARRALYTSVAAGSGSLSTHTTSAQRAIAYMHLKDYGITGQSVEAEEMMGPDQRAVLPRTSWLEFTLRLLAHFAHARLIQ